MAEVNIVDSEIILRRIRDQADREDIRITQHAQQEMVEDEINIDEVLETIATGEILENYPEHKRGSCCLFSGVTHANRPIHIVCTTSQPILIIITVYEPRPPKWITPNQRR